MNEKDWDKRLFDFLKQKAEEIKAETQRLMEEVGDPQTQRKMRERLREFGTWAKQAVEDAAEMVEGAVKKAETAFSQRMESASAGPHTQSPTSAGAATTTTESAPRRSASRGARTVGKSKKSTPVKKRSPRPAKTIGRKK